MTLFGVALLFLLGGGVLALALAQRPALSAALATIGAVAGGCVGEVAAVRALLDPTHHTDVLVRPWEIPYGELHVAIDPLSAFFLVPVFGFSAIAAIYGRAYLAGDRKGRRAVSSFAFNALVASMACVVVARHAVLLIVAWEVMTVCGYLLITYEHEDAEVRRAGWVYLLASHVGVAFLLALFVVFARRSGSFDFDAMRVVGTAPRGLPILLVALAIVGFGVKAGIVPLHVWLPEAHAAAPSHVSALMSAVLIKMGVYGILRTLLLLGRPAAWWSGPTLMILGLSGAVVGISLAMYQRDIKRVLAYSSVENVGIILLAFGVGFWGASSGRPIVAALGMTGGLLHLWNHTLMKGLLFLSAGSIVHGCGTKDLEQLGGVAKRMPRTATMMIAGAVAISALPPMNGFVSEWLVYLGLIQGAVDATNAPSVVALLAVGAVAFVGAVTVLCFVRLVGISLLGAPRSAVAGNAHESGAGMLGPMGLLAVACALAGLLAPVLAGAVAPVVTELSGLPRTNPPSLVVLSVINGVLWLVIATGLLIARKRASARATSGPTWDCGYAAPTARMQYTARSFAEMVGERFLPRAAQPRISASSPVGLFPQRTSFSSTCDDPVTRSIYEPLFSRSGDRFVRFRWLQQGMLHAYLLYILVAVAGLLTWISLRSWVAP